MLFPITFIRLNKWRRSRYRIIASVDKSYASSAISEAFTSRYLYTLYVWHLLHFRFWNCQNPSAGWEFLNRSTSCLKCMCQVNILLLKVLYVIAISSVFENYSPGYNIVRSLPFSSFCVDIIERILERNIWLWKKFIAGQFLPKFAFTCNYVISSFIYVVISPLFVTI